jgi:ADP-heptose:LPS heptosyltransferase
MDINERAAAWPKETLQEIAELTKNCKAGIGRKIHLLAPKPDDMDTLKEILKLTQEYRGGIGATIWRRANHTLTHVTIVRVAQQSCVNRNN